MTAEYAEVILSWLAKARSDLSTARILAAGAVGAQVVCLEPVPSFNF
jgi:hypothetical protein